MIYDVCIFANILIKQSHRVFLSSQGGCNINMFALFYVLWLLGLLVAGAVGSSCTREEFCNSMLR